jgi:hypothetical protein
MKSNFDRSSSRARLTLHPMNKHSVRMIKTHRTLTELRLEQLLQDIDSSMTIDDVKRLIFEFGRDDFRTYLTAVLSTLDSDVDEIEESELQVVQDAWNYFPHRFLDGRCPAELLMELTGEDSSQLP